MPTSAAVIHQSDGRITFAVDDVEPAAAPLPLTGARALFARRSATPLLAFSHDNARLVHVSRARRTPGEAPDWFEDEDADERRPGNALVTAVHLAFAQHRPLLLSPDVIWLTIAQGFAQHVNNHAEALRDRFVRHTDRQTITVEAEPLSDQSASQVWAGWIEEWVTKMRPALGPGHERLLVCDFSTTTPASRTASQIVLMDTFKRYFHYRLACICGIPQITLLGTPADWSAIRARAALLAEYDLAWWTDRLLPICDALVATAEGRPPLEFWRTIYKPKSSYGEDRITGWLVELFPYLRAGPSDTPTKPNHILSKPRAELTERDGIPPSLLPPGLSCAPVTKEEQGKLTALELVAGFIGVAQDGQGGLLPEIGWAVRPQEGLAQSLTRLANEHRLNPPVSWDRRSIGDLELPAGLIQLLNFFNGGDLYAGSPHPWRLRPLAAYQGCWLNQNYESATVFADLADGRVLACKLLRGDGDDQVELLLGRVETETDSRGHASYHLPPETTRTIGRGLEQLFERMLAAEGRYFFDESDAMF